MDKEQDLGVRAGSRASHEAPAGSSPKASIPDAITPRSWAEVPRNGEPVCIGHYIRFNPITKGWESAYWREEELIWRAVLVEAGDAAPGYWYALPDTAMSEKIREANIYTATYIVTFKRSPWWRRLLPPWRTRRKLSVDHSFPQKFHTPKWRAVTLPEAAQGIEAGTDETRSGSAEGESPVPEGDAPKGTGT